MLPTRVFQTTYTVMHILIFYLFMGGLRCMWRVYDFFYKKDYDILTSLMCVLQISVFSLLFTLQNKLMQ